MTAQHGSKPASRKDLNIQLVSSSNIAAVGSDGPDLLLWFHSSSRIRYRYKNAAYLYEAIMAAESVGKYFHKHIRGCFEAIREKESI